MPRFPWGKVLFGLTLVVALVWGLAWGRKQEAAFAQARADVVVAQAKAHSDSVALAASLWRWDSVMAQAVVTAAEVRALGQRIAASTRRDDSLRLADSLARATAPPDTSVAAVGFWKGIVARQDLRLAELTGRVADLRAGWHLDSLTWAATRAADADRFAKALGLSETRRQLAEAALKAAGGDACRIAFIGRCPSRTLTALMAAAVTAAAIKL
jgi:hypothetical protein